MSKKFLHLPVFFACCVIASFSLFILLSIDYHLFTQQLLFFVIGFIILFILWLTDYTVYKSLAGYIYFSVLIALLIPFLLPPVRGAHRWIYFDGFRLQPSELAKPFLTLCFAYFLTSRPSIKLSNLLFNFLIFFLPFILVFKQPDLGNAIVYLVIWLSILFASNVKTLFFALVSILLFCILPFSWFILKDYQRARIISFFNPLTDPQGAGYNIIQSIIAIGSGQIIGRGFGKGTQSHLRFLPEQHTDFIFASLTEETGLIGALIIFICFFILLFSILSTTSSHQDNFCKIFTIGIFTQFIVQFFINIGMNLGLLPITGITLPLVSYGGSSIISSFISLGMILSIRARQRSYNSLAIK